MNAKLVFTAIIQVAKLIPAIMDGLESLYSMFLQWKIDQIQSDEVSKEQKKFLLLDKIKEAKIGFELINLSKFSLSYSDYIKLFYLIAKYQLELASSSNKVQLTKIQEEYEYELLDDDFESEN